MLAWAHIRGHPIPNGISIGSAVSAWLAIVTDGQTDRQTTLLRLYCTIGRIYVVLRCGLILVCQYVLVSAIFCVAFIVNVSVDDYVE